MKLIDKATGNIVRASIDGAKLLVERGTHEHFDESKVPAATPPAAAGWPDTHAGLDELAEKLGVEWPEPTEGKKRLTVAEKVAALEEAGHTPE